MSAGFPDYPITRDHPITRFLSAPPRLRDEIPLPISRWPDVPITRSARRSFAALRERFQSALQTVRAALREIFDESAYERFLLRTKAERSRASYRRFMQEREAGMCRRPKCC